MKKEPICWAEEKGIRRQRNVRRRWRRRMVGGAIEAVWCISSIEALEGDDLY